MDGLPAQSRSLDLGGTQAALARLAALGAVAAPAPVQLPPAGWVGLIDRGLRTLGNKNGTADLPAALRAYLPR